MPLKPTSLSLFTAVDQSALREQVQQIFNHQFPKGMRTGKATSEALKEVLTRISLILTPASPTGDIDNLASRIRLLIENSGLYFEKRLETAIISLKRDSTPSASGNLAAQPAIRKIFLNDLKPNLLFLKQFLLSQPPDGQGLDWRNNEVLKRLVGRSLAYIDQQQQAAAEKPAEPDMSQVFSHLLMLRGVHRDARLNIYYTRKGNDGKSRTPRVALLLDMDRMGKVRTDLWMVAKDLNVTFFVETAETKAIIDSARFQVETALLETFETVAVRVVVSEKKIEQFSQVNAAPSGGRQVDLNI